MKTILCSLITAFSFWSKIPVKQIPWKEENLRYALCFFPLVGAIVGICFYYLGILALNMGWSDTLRGALLALVPVIITGGIHHDGFCDVMDALSSWRDREKKLEILSDSRCGAFAVIGMVCLMVLTAGLMAELNEKALLFCALGFPLSRALAAAVLLTFPCAKPDGLAALCQKAAPKQINIMTVLVTAVLILAFMSQILPRAEGITAIALAVFLFWFRHRTISAFGGITGDTIGFLIVISETIIAAGGALLCLID